MKGGSAYEPLLRRSHTNPILTAAHWPYPVHSVFNAGAVRLKNGTTLLLCRVEDRRGLSHLCAARSPDGVSDWVIDQKPTLSSHPDHPEELWGIEDPRITWVDDMGCKAGAGTTTSHTVTAFANANAYHSELTMSHDPPSTGPATRTVVDGQWLGACKAE
jgi:predicted GH43/DUF377 family glycosyl hydrolase